MTAQNYVSQLIPLLDEFIDELIDLVSLRRERLFRWFFGQEAA